MSHENPRDFKPPGGHPVLLAVILAAAAFAGGRAEGGSSAGYILRSGGFSGAAGTGRSAGFRQSGEVTSRYPAYSSNGAYRLLGNPWQTSREACLVDFAEYAVFAESWLQSGPGVPADLDGDRDVDVEDLARLADVWLAGCPAGLSAR